MSAQPPDPEIEKLLAELRSDDHWRRVDAANKIAGLNLRNDEVTQVLKQVASSDPKWYASEAAVRALTAIGVEPPPRLPVESLTPSSPAKPGRQWSRNEKIRDFAIGFVGWYVVNGGLYLTVFTGNPGGGFYNLLLLPVNVIVLIIAAFRRQWFALGLLASFAVNLVLALLLGLTLNAFCWIPFFIK